MTPAPRVIASTVGDVWLIETRTIDGVRQGQVYERARPGAVLVFGRANGTPFTPSNVRKRALTA